MRLPALPPRPEGEPRVPEIERMEYEAWAMRADGEGLLDLGREAFHWQPAAGRWSPSQCFEHLLRFSERWLDRLEAATRQARAAGRLHPGPYAYGLVDRWLLKAHSPGGRSLWRAPAWAQPFNQLTVEQARAALFDLHGRLAALLKDANGVDLQRVRVRHPVLPLRLSLGMSLWMLMRHARRHLEQAQGVLREWHRHGARRAA